jgi:hypothetical protein
MLKWQNGEASIIGWLLQTKGLIEIIFANILLDKQFITSETFTALLLMAAAQHHADRASCPAAAIPGSQCGPGAASRLLRPVPAVVGPGWCGTKMELSGAVAKAWSLFTFGRFG